MWTINGPVDHLLGFAAPGTRATQRSVTRSRLGPEGPPVLRSFVREASVVDGDRAATRNRLHRDTRLQPTGAISYRVAQFLRFRDGKIAEY